MGLASYGTELQKSGKKSINLMPHLAWDVDTVVVQSVGINNHYNSNVLSNIIILNFYLYFNYFLYLSRAIISAFVDYFFCYRKFVLISISTPQTTNV